MNSKYERMVLPRLAEVRDWAMRGVREKDIAGNLGVGYSTFRGYTAKHEALKEALSIGKNSADAIVSNAFFDKCRDRIVQIPRLKKTQREIINERGDREIKMEYVEVSEPMFIPADTAAQKLWLCNRRPDEWQQQVRADISGGIDIKVEWEGSDEYSC